MKINVIDEIGVTCRNEENGERQVVIIDVVYWCRLQVLLRDH